MSRHDILRKCSRSKIKKFSYLTYLVILHIHCSGAAFSPLFTLWQGDVHFLKESECICAQCGPEHRTGSCCTVVASVATSFLPKNLFSYCFVTLFSSIAQMRFGQNVTKVYFPRVTLLASLTSQLTPSSHQGSAKAWADPAVFAYRMQEKQAEHITSWEAVPAQGRFSCTQNPSGIYLIPQLWERVS